MPTSQSAYKSTLDNTNLDSWLGPLRPAAGAGGAQTDRSVLIMDEVDGMSGGDRGGVGALNALIRKTKIPIIAIANDAGSQKMRPLKGTTFAMVFRR